VIVSLFLAIAAGTMLSIFLHKKEAIQSMGTLK
jgi:hypothetical protein